MFIAALLSAASLARRCLSNRASSRTSAADFSFDLPPNETFLTEDLPLHEFDSILQERLMQSLYLV